MKKLLAPIRMFIIAIKTYTIDPSGSRLDYGESGIDLLMPRQATPFAAHFMFSNIFHCRFRCFQ